MPCPVPSAAGDHSSLRLGLMEAGRALRGAAEDEAQFPEAHRTVLAVCLDRLLPHLAEDEQWLLAARGCAAGRLLAEAMRSEARAITAAVLELRDARTPCEAIATTRALHALLAAHEHHAELLRGAAAEAGPEPESRSPYPPEPEEPG